MMTRMKMCAVLALLVMTAANAAQQKLAFDIAPQVLTEALIKYSEQSGIQVSSPSTAIEGKSSAGVVGAYSPSDALTRVLNGTGLAFDFIDERTVAVREEKAVYGMEGSSGNGVLRVAQSGATTNPEAQSSGEQRKNLVEEIVVTAQKRVERLQDVPVPVTAISAESLVNINQMRLEDYYTRIPGLNLTALGNGAGSSIAIRGLTTGGYLNPTVGVVVDDVPFGASITVANGAFNLRPNLDPSELARIEVLRGPQGTLYGASSIGGLLKFVTVAPITDELSGRVQVGAAAVEDGEVGYSARAAANVPLSDTLAVRVSGSSRRDPGYIDNIGTGQDHVNSIDSESARIAALWRPADNFSLVLSALYQKTERDGSADVTLAPGLGDLEQNLPRGTGTYEQTFQAYSATAVMGLGEAELTSLTGYNVGQMSYLADVTPTYGPYIPGITAAGSDLEATKFSQEFRFSTPIGSSIEWLLGVFYTDEDTPAPSDTVSLNPDGSVAANLAHFDLAANYTEYAVFTNFTFQLAERLDVQVGARQSHNEVSYTGLTGTGPLLTNVFFLPDPYITPAFDAEDGPFTYLVTPRFRVSADLMLYARFASGYRPGGPNSLTAPAPGVPTSYEHDTAQTYEVGAKGGLMGGALTFDASLYFIDWKDVQLQVVDPANFGISYILNAREAQSQGVELSVVARPLNGLTLSAWSAYNDAKITEGPANTALVSAGSEDRLPYSARWSGHISVDQEFPLASIGASGFVGASVSYVGDRNGRFFAGVPQETFPSYTQADLRAGARFDAWAVNAFVNNVADKRGVLRSGLDATYSNLITYIQPRTMGINVSYNW